MASEQQVLGTGRTGGREATKGVIAGRYALSVGCPDSVPPTEWKWTKLSDVATLESGHTPSRRHPEYWDGHIPWIGIKDANDHHGRVIHDTIQHVTEMGLANSSARLLPKDTVCLSRTASIGFVTVMGRPMATSQDFVNWVCGPGIDHTFLKYVLLADREALFRFAHGTTHQTIYFPEAKAFHVCLPPIKQQKRIAHILGTLDDKIELNRRMNATLETMARALFKSWFVDFDPVRAKQQGRPPAGLDPATAALFPAEFEESELGEIPKGWEAGTLGEVAINLRRGVEADELDRTAAYIGLEHMPRRSIALADWGTAEELESNKSAFKRNEILFGKLRPYFHKVGVAPVDGVCSTDILVISTTSAEWFGFVLGHCSSDALVAHTDAMSTGTKMPRANWKDIAGYSVVLPSIEMAAAFTRAVHPLVDRVCANIHESRILAAVRDALLPKLLSGKILPNTRS